MSLTPVRAGFLPLSDAAPLIIARELGFAEEEGLDLVLARSPSWSALRDAIAFGQVDAASLLSVVPVASALGLGGLPGRIDALMVTSLGGEAIAVSRDLAARMRQDGHNFDPTDALSARKALLSATAPGDLRIAAPFPFSMHTELLHRWLGAGIGALRTVPPPLMTRALSDGEVDLFCVGEPWGSVAVERGVGEFLLTGRAIWRGAPEKVLAMRHDLAEAEPDLAGQLMRAVWRACRWLSLTGNDMTTAEILARPEYLDLPAEVIDRSLSGRLITSPEGDTRDAGQVISFFEGCATFPWRSQAAWIGERLALRHGRDPVTARKVARDVFRSDLYRHHLGPAGADLPAASSRLEGAVGEPGYHPSAAGRVALLPDPFFDGAVFDPGSD